MRPRGLVSAERGQGHDLSWMETVPLFALLKNWVARSILRRPIPPLLRFDPALDEPPGSDALSDEPALSPALAGALAQRLNAVTPWHVQVAVFITERGGVGHRIRSLLWLSWREGEELGGTQETALVNLLGAVQGYMSDKTKRAWPGSAKSPRPPNGKGGLPSRQEIEDHAVEFFRRLPLPGVAIDAEIIRLWYGDESDPVLRLDPIPTSSSSS